MVCLYVRNPFDYDSNTVRERKGFQHMERENRLQTSTERFEMIAPLLNDKLDAFERRRLRAQILEAYGISARSLRRYIHTYKGHQKFCSAKPLPMVAPDFFPVPYYPLKYPWAYRISSTLCGSNLPR